MSKFLFFLIVMIYITNASSSWQKTGIKSQVFLSVDFPTEDNGYVMAGASVYTTSDGGKNFNPVQTPPTTKLAMANACSGATDCVVTGLAFVSSPNAYTTDGKTYTASDNKWLQAACQDAEITADGSYATTGNFGSTNGVAVSKDGKKFTVFNWGFDNKQSLARYSTFPTATTWYVAGGAWPQQPSNKLYVTETGVFSAKELHSLSQNIHLVKKTSEIVYDFPLERNEYVNDANNTFIATIQKTTDGGKTWTNVFSDESTFYFNQIDCIDENTCFAAGEGDSGAYVYSTFDGGKTWAASVSAPAGESLMSLKCIDDTTCWAAGGVQTRSNFVGHFYLTQDAGKTWTLQTELKGTYVFDLSFISTTSGWATAFLPDKQGELLRFN